MGKRYENVDVNPSNQPIESEQPTEASVEHARTLETNRRVWDTMARQGQPLCTPASDEELADPLKHVDPLGWLGNSIRGWRVLCLAAGGGRHSALYSAAGACVTVVDLSPEMLALDRQVASERGYSIRVIEASMDSLPMLESEYFDLVIHPVSTCYIPDVAPVFREVARLLRRDALYVSQHKQPVSLQSSMDADGEGAYRILHRYYRTAAVPIPSKKTLTAARLREFGATEYLHRWEQIVGGICRAGFVIEDLVEPVHAKEQSAIGSFAHRAAMIAPYVRIKARRKRWEQPISGGQPTGSLWLPPNF